MSRFRGEVIDEHPDVVDEAIEALESQINDTAIIACSGGIDRTVAAVLATVLWGAFCIMSMSILDLCVKRQKKFVRCSRKWALIYRSSMLQIASLPT